MPLAVETFTAELNGDLIEIRAGFDYVADGHELVRRFPDCFLADRETIETEFLSTTRDGGVESGGWLYAPVSRSWDKEIEIRLASTPGKGARCTPKSYFPSADYHAEEKQFASLGSDIVRVGDWHSHPGRNAGASDGDIDAWLKSFLVANEKRGVASYVGLIVAEDDSRGAVRAKFKAFALSYDLSGRVVCEPAN